MCGICGFTGVQCVRDAEGVVMQMCNRIRHRGPDDEGYFVDSSVALGMRRLSILDVPHGKQPMFNETGRIVVVYNGEIYNYLELRSDLQKKGHQLTTRCDTEVIPHLYEERGPDFPKALNGMYAVVIWDRHEKRLVMARDRMGEKPLYYSVLPGGNLVFGSELKCLTEHPAVSKVLDPVALYQYFVFGYIPAPRTIYKNVWKLPAASILDWHAGQYKVSRYWEVPRRIENRKNRSELVEELRELLEDAVVRRMISDVPLGAFLSGGIDSSVVVALMAQHATSPVKTFHIRFQGDDQGEQLYARQVANRFGTDHYEYEVAPDAVAVLANVVSQFDEPFGDASAIPTWYLSQFTRRHVTVALSGDGGDESFGGYRRYREILGRRDLRWVRKFFKPFATVVSRFVPSRLPGYRTVLCCGQGNPEFYILGSRDLEARRLLHRDIEEQLPDSASEQFQDYLDDRLWGDPLLRYSDFDIHWYLPDDILVKVDRMSMAHSLEVRAPFLDHRIVEWAARLPCAWKLNSNDSKLILKEAFRELLPPGVLQPRKRGFSMPLHKWLLSELRPTVEAAISDTAIERAGLLRLATARQWAYEHWSGIRDRSAQLWWILVFTQWWKQFAR